ncbi:MAG TPA: IS110 family transposase [Puia sp.]|jgi:transposase|nr:IS110 family transposase [Puia sp.]
MKQKIKGIPVLHADAAGIDIANRVHYVAVNPANDNPVRSFGTFTEDLQSLVAWLISCGVTTVAMEATGVYWVNVFLLIEQAGIEVVLVNAKHVKNVTGKKTDMTDAEWIRQLHSCGLLHASFQPDAFTRSLRSYMRHRKNLLDMGATHIRMMQKAMELMNIKLQNVIADITGKTGLAIINAILNGEREPANLIALTDGRIKASREDIKRSLQGIWKDEYIFELQQSFDMYHAYQAQIIACDKRIEELVKSRTTGGYEQITLPEKKSSRNKNNLHFDARQILQEITGIDLTEIFGISDSTAMEVLSEVGFDMTKWPTAKHFTAWLNLAPNTKKSGDKIISSKIPKKKNRAGQVFKMAAYAVQRSKNWLAAFYHRIKNRAGAQKAITATARKIAVIFYKMMADKVMFNPISLETYGEDYKKHQLKRLEKQAKQFGLQLTPMFN